MKYALGFFAIACSIALAQTTPARPPIIVKHLQEAGVIVSVPVPGGRELTLKSA